MFFCTDVSGSVLPSLKKHLSTGFPTAVDVLDAMENIVDVHLPSIGEDTFINRFLACV